MRILGSWVCIHPKHHNATMTIFDIINEGPVVYADETTGYVFNLNEIRGIRCYKRIPDMPEHYLRVKGYRGHGTTDVNDAETWASDWFADLVAVEPDPETMRTGFGITKEAA